MSVVSLMVVVISPTIEYHHLGRIPRVILDHEFRLTLTSCGRIELDRDEAGRPGRKLRAAAHVMRINREVASTLNRDTPDNGCFIVPPRIEQESVLRLTMLPDPA
jgi:hypothetical protein